MQQAFPVLSDIGKEFDDVLQVPLRLHRFGNVVAVGFEFVLPRGVLDDLALFHRLDKPCSSVDGGYSRTAHAQR